MIRGAPQLPPEADLGALRDLLLRVSRLSEDLPEVTDLDLDRSSPARTARPWWTRGSR